MTFFIDEVGAFGYLGLIALLWHLAFLFFKSPNDDSRAVRSFAYGLPPVFCRGTKKGKMSAFQLIIFPLSRYAIVF